MQNLLGPLEHKQFMEEVTKRDPFLGSLLMVSAPFYTGMKMMGVNPSDDKSTLTSAGSVDEIFSAFDGYMKGLGI